MHCNFQKNAQLCTAEHYSIFPYSLHVGPKRCDGSFMQAGFDAEQRELEQWLVCCHKRTTSEALGLPSRSHAAWRMEYACIEEVRCVCSCTESASA